MKETIQHLHSIFMSITNERVVLNTSHVIIIGDWFSSTISKKMVGGEGSQYVSVAKARQMRQIERWTLTPFSWVMYQNAK